MEAAVSSLSSPKQNSFPTFSLCLWMGGAGWVWFHNHHCSPGQLQKHDIMFVLFSRFSFSLLKERSLDVEAAIGRMITGCNLTSQVLHFLYFWGCWRWRSSVCHGGGQTRPLGDRQLDQQGWLCPKHRALDLRQQSCCSHQMPSACWSAGNFPSGKASYELPMATVTSYHKLCGL